MHHSAHSLMLFRQANDFRQKEALNDALDCYDQTLLLSPDFIEALYNRAGVLATLGRMEDAVSSYTRVLTLSPDHGPTLANLALLYGKSGDVTKALEVYAQLLRLEPDNVGALINQGLLLSHKSKFAEALQSFEAVLSQTADHPAALGYAGQMLYRLRRYEAALERLGRAASVPAPQAWVLDAMGNVLTELGRHGEAMTWYNRALALQPGNIALLYNVAGALQSTKRFAEAAKVFAKVAAASSGSDDRAFHQAIGNELYCRLNACDWTKPLSVAPIIKALQAGRTACAPFAMLALSGDPAHHRLCAEVHINNLKKTKPFLDTAPASQAYHHDKIRLGYFSADLREHAVANLAAQLFEEHNRSRFEIYAFSLRPPEDSEQGKRLVAAFDHFIDVSGMIDLQAAQKAHANEIDIAIDLMGYTRGSRPGIFSFRPAPVQVSYLGFAGTTGASQIDYLVADDIVIPEDACGLYTEKIVRMPHSFMARDTTRKLNKTGFTRAKAGLPDEAIVFCNFGGAYKITFEVFAGWMRILSRVDHAVLWLSALNADARVNLRREAERLGVDRDRILFADQTPNLNDHLSRHQLADIFLDTLPYGAHATASDALWSGLPVLTCMGSAFPGRVAASLLTALEMPELISSTLEAYEDAAVSYAGDSRSLQELKDRLREKTKSNPVFDTKRYIRDFEKALFVMHDRHSTGQSPDHLRVADILCSD